MKKGQLLFTLDKRRYEAEVQSAKAQRRQGPGRPRIRQGKVTR